MSAIKRIRQTIRAMDDNERKALSGSCGVPFNIVCHASGAGSTVNAEAYLALCFALGIDAVTGGEAPPSPRPISICWALLAIAVNQKRIALGLGLRKAAPKAGVSYVTIQRAENAHPLSVVSLLKLCAWLGVHPSIYTQRRPPGQAAYVGELRAGQAPEVSHDRRCNTRRAAA